MMKRILYLCADPGIPFWGTKGASIHMREFTRALMASGRSATVAVSRLGRSAGSPDDFLPVVGLPQNDSPFFVPPNAADPVEMTLASEARQVACYGSVCNALDELHRREPFDAICERYSLFGVAGRDTARRWGVPYILEVNAPLVGEAQSHRRLVLAPLARAVEKYLFSTADQVVAVSATLAEYIRTVAPEGHVMVIPNGVDLARFNGDAQPADAGWGSDDPGCFRVGFVGSLKPWHGVENLIDAFAILRKRQSGTRLVIVGDGPNRAALEESVERKGMSADVLFTGPLAHDRIPAALQMMDVVTAPYPASETFYFSPLKVYEYMAAGKAIVASHIGQMVDILRDRETALLPAPGDVNALAAALEELQADGDLRRSLGECARKTAHAGHGWNHRMGEWGELFERLGDGVEPRSEFA